MFFRKFSFIVLSMVLVFCSCSKEEQELGLPVEELEKSIDSKLYSGDNITGVWELDSVIHIKNTIVGDYPFGTYSIETDTLKYYNKYLSIEIYVVGDYPSDLSESGGALKVIYSSDPNSSISFIGNSWYEAEMYISNDEDYESEYDDTFNGIRLFRTDTREVNSLEIEHLGNLENNLIEYYHRIE